MTKRLSGSAFILALVVLAVSPGPALAQGTAYGSALGFSIKGGYVLPSDAFQAGHILAGGALLVRLSANFVLEVEGDFSLISVTAQPLGLSRGHLLHIPLAVSLRARLPLRGLPLAPYLIAGGGAALNIFSLDRDMVADFQDLGFDIEETARPAFMAQFGGGVEILIAPNLSLDVQGRYRLSRTTSKWSISDQVTRAAVSGTTDRVDLNAVQILGGLRFLFN